MAERYRLRATEISPTKTLNPEASWLTTMRDQYDQTTGDDPEIPGPPPSESPKRKIEDIWFLAALIICAVLLFLIIFGIFRNYSQRWIVSGLRLPLPGVMSGARFGS